MFLGCSSDKQSSNPNGELENHNDNIVEDVNTEYPDDEEYVDLGLSQGTLWATCNVGATKPEEYGDYFAWGEVKPKKVYTWKNYKWCDGSGMSLTKYCDWEDGTYGYFDDRDELEADDDAAIINWGDKWRVPTPEEVRNLIDGCDWKWVKDYNGTGIAGTIGVSKQNSKTIFFPETGYRHGDKLVTDRDHSGCSVESEGGYSSYWSSARGECYPGSAYTLDFPMSYLMPYADHCCQNCYGLCVRAVVNNTPKIKPVDHEGFIPETDRYEWPKRYEWKRLETDLFYDGEEREVKKRFIKQITHFEYEDPKDYSELPSRCPDFCEFINMYIDVFDYIAIPTARKDECLCYMLQLLCDFCDDFNSKYSYGDAVGASKCLDFMISMNGYDFVERIKQQNYYGNPKLKDFRDFDNMPFGDPKRYGELDSDIVIVYGRVVDKDGYVNLRESSDSKSNVIGRVSTGDDVRIIYKTQDDVEFGQMLNVVTKDGRVGYVHRSRLKLYSMYSDKSRRKMLESFGIQNFKEYEW